MLSAASQRLAFVAAQGARSWTSAAGTATWGRVFAAAARAPPLMPAAAVFGGRAAPAAAAAWPFGPPSSCRQVSVQGNDLKKGSFIRVDGEVFQVLGKEHARSGKGGGFVQADIRSLRTGTRVTKRFRSKGEKIEQVVVDSNHDYQLLEKTETSLTFMHTATFEQVTVDRALVPNGLLVEGMVMQVAFADGEALQATLPVFVELTAKDTVAVAVSSSDTSYKPVQTEEGLEVFVPMFINSGEVVKMRADTGEYVERVR